MKDNIDTGIEVLLGAFYICLIVLISPILLLLWAFGWIANNVFKYKG